MEMHEAHMPGRVARQFGRIQRIPSEPIETLRAVLCRGAKSYVKTYGPMDQTFREFPDSLYNPEAMGPVAIIPGETVEGYMDWYRRVSRPLVENPAHAGIGDQPPAQETSYTRVIRVRKINIFEWFTSFYLNLY